MILRNEIFREAWRNTRTGSSRPIVLAFLFLVTVGLLGVLQTLSIMQIDREAENWRAIGASTQIVSMPGKIDGARCESLGHIPGVTASGAVRQGDAITLAALPSTSFSSFEATPGLANILRAEKLSTDAGVWISNDLAERLGVNNERQAAIYLTTGLILRVSAVYRYPEDGRLPTLSYNLVNQVPATGIFDTCWVEIWPENGSLNSLLTFPVSVTGQFSESESPQIQQLNTSEGTSFSGNMRLTRLPGWLFISTSALLGLVIGYSLTWLRKLELASALHAGLDKTSLCFQLIIETAFSLFPATFFSFAFTLLIAGVGNLLYPWPIALPGFSVVATGFVAAVFGCVGAILLITEKRLFRYFASR